MVAATQPPPPQQQQQQQQQQQTPTITAEEEALKRNTDCVYFLASPLTCKKGSECEYRHSEYARINPRDCYFWLNGNCLNPKCGFRHPPLDGLLGAQTAPSSGSSLPPLQTAVIPATHAPQSSGKQAVPCIFFQKGLCLKGDRCAFLHGPNPTSNKSPQLTVATTATEPPSLKKAFGGLQKFTQEQKIPATNVSKVVGVTLEAKHGPKVETAPPRNGMGIERNVAPPTGLSEEVPRYKATNVPSVVNGNSVSRSNRLHQINVSDDHGLQNGKDADEFLRESSPGFDVLVDDELRDSDYYHGEDQFGRTRGHEGRNLNSVDEYNIGLSADYNSMADVDREMFRDPRGYDSYDHMQGQYGWEQHRTSTERMLVGPSHLDRRGYAKSESPDHIDESDLRYRLSKQRGVNGLRSVVSHDYVPDNHVEERSYRGSSRRDSHHLPQRESSLSRRLRGRIKLPVRSPVNDSELLAEREMDRGRSRSRLSPGRPQISSHEGRLHDRIKGRVEENYNEGRNLRGPRMRREIIDDRRSDFARPKSLAELKVKNVENKENNSLRKRKSLEDHQQSEGDLSFEGPMPLSEILKRKRKAGAAAFGSGMSSVNEEENNNIAVAATEGTADDVGTTEEKTEVAHDQPSELANVGDLETEDGMIGDDGMEDHELEGDEQRDGEYEYEQVDEEGDYNYEEGENADAEEEYLEEEDGDDFAKKIGVMFS